MFLCFWIFGFGGAHLFKIFRGGLGHICVDSSFCALCVWVPFVSESSLCGFHIFWAPCMDSIVLGLVLCRPFAPGPCFCRFQLCLGPSALDIYTNKAQTQKETTQSLCMDSSVSGLVQISFASWLCLCGFLLCQGPRSLTIHRETSQTEPRTGTI